MQTITRKQHELLCAAKGIGLGWGAQKTANVFDVHPAAILHHRRRLRHLRVTADELADAIAAVPWGAMNDYLLDLFAARRREQKQRTKAAKQAKGGAA